jgi:hypothetical protein
LRAGKIVFDLLTEPSSVAMEIGKRKWQEGRYVVMAGLPPREAELP